LAQTTFVQDWCWWSLVAIVCSEQSYAMAAFVAPVALAPAVAYTTAAQSVRLGWSAPSKPVAAESLASRRCSCPSSLGNACGTLGVLGVALVTCSLRHCGAGHSSERQRHQPRGRGDLHPTATALQAADSSEVVQPSDSAKAVKEAPPEPVAQGNDDDTRKAVPGHVCHGRRHRRWPRRVAALTTALIVGAGLAVSYCIGHPPQVVAAARLTMRVVFAGMLAFIAGSLIKTLIERIVKVTIEAIDRSLLGVDIRIRKSSLTFFRPRDGGIKVVLSDVEVGNPEGFDHDIMMFAKQVVVEFALWHFLWTWFSPRKKQIQIDGATLTDVQLMYETPTPDLGLTNSNISMLINHIRQRLGYTSATDAATEETTASATDAATEKTTASATDAATEKTTAAYEPCFHLHRLKTEGLTASVSVGGVDLPLERTLVPIADIKIDDLTGDVRSNLAQFRELKAEGGGLAPIVGHVVEKLNERVVEQLSRETLDKGAVC